MGESSQKPVKIDGELWDYLDKWLTSKKAKEMGFHSKAQFVTQAVRELLQEYTASKSSRQQLEETTKELLERIKTLEKTWVNTNFPETKKKQLKDLV